MVTYPKISPRMVNPRDTAGNIDEEEEEVFKELTAIYGREMQYTTKLKKDYLHVIVCCR